MTSCLPMAVNIKNDSPDDVDEELSAVPVKVQDNGFRCSYLCARNACTLARLKGKHSLQGLRTPRTLTAACGILWARWMKQSRQDYKIPVSERSHGKVDYIKTLIPTTPQTNLKQETNNPPGILVWADFRRGARKEKGNPIPPILKPRIRRNIQ